LVDVMAQIEVKKLNLSYGDFHALIDRPFYRDKDDNRHDRPVGLR